MTAVKQHLDSVVGIVFSCRRIAWVSPRKRWPCVSCLQLGNEATETLLFGERYIFEKTVAEIFMPFYCSLFHLFSECWCLSFIIIPSLYWTINSWCLGPIVSPLFLHKGWTRQPCWVTTVNTAWISSWFTVQMIHPRLTCSRW